MSQRFSGMCLRQKAIREMSYNKTYCGWQAGAGGESEISQRQAENFRGDSVGIEEWADKIAYELQMINFYKRGKRKLKIPKIFIFTKDEKAVKYKRFLEYKRKKSTKDKA